MQSNDRATINRLLERNRQSLLPVQELLEGAQFTISELMEEAAAAVVEQFLVLSAQELAGDKQHGRDEVPVLCYGAQYGMVALVDHQLRMLRMQLQEKSDPKVAVLAYERLRGPAGLGAGVRNISGADVSTRRNASVLSKVAGTALMSESMELLSRFLDVSFFSSMQFAFFVVPEGRRRWQYKPEIRFATPRSEKNLAAAIPAAALAPQA